MVCAGGSQTDCALAHAYSAKQFVLFQRREYMFDHSSKKPSSARYQVPRLRLFSVFCIAAFLLAPMGASAAPQAGGNGCQLNSFAFSEPSFIPFD